MNLSGGSGVFCDQSHLTAAGLPWMEHSWCLLGGKIVETENAHDIYYGAELSPDEYKVFAERCGKSDLTARENARLWTIGIEGFRTIVPYNPVLYADVIGRQRDKTTNEPTLDFNV